MGASANWWDNSPALTPEAASLAPQATDGKWWDNSELLTPEQPTTTAPRETSAPMGAADIISARKAVADKYPGSYVPTQEEADAMAADLAVNAKKAAPPPKSFVGYLGKSALEGIANTAQAMGNAAAIEQGQPELRVDEPMAPALRKMIGMPDYQPTGGFNKALGGGVSALTGGGPLGLMFPALTFAAGVGSDVGGDVGEAVGGTPGRVIGSVGGGLVGGVSPTVVGAGFRNIGRGIKNATAPLGAQGQQRLAAESLLNSATDPAAIRARLAENTAAPEPLVPGSQPTTAAVTAPVTTSPDGIVETGAVDPGVAAWERRVRTSSPTAGADFQQRYREQAQAQNQAISGVAPSGDASAVGRLFTAKLAELETARDQAQTAAQGAVTQRTDALGARQPSEAYGAQARATLEQNLAASNVSEGKLWDALKPYDQAPVHSGPVLEARDSVLGEMKPEAGDTLSPQEKTVFDAAGKWGDTTTFGALRALRSNIGAAQRAVRADPAQGASSAAMRRLTILNQSVDEALENAVSDVGQREAAAVAGGQMPSEATLQSKLQTETAQWQEARNAAIKGGGRGSSGTQGVGGVGGPSIPGARGAEGGQAGGPSVTPGGPSVPQSPLGAEGAAAYKAARGATLEQKQTFGQGAPGDILAPGPKGAPYRLADSGVAERALRNPESVRQYLAAGGDPELLKNFLVANLRQSNVIDQTGLVNASRLLQFLQGKYRDVLDQIPGLKGQLGDVKTAQEFLDQSIAQHTKAIEDFQTSKAGEFIGGDPTKVVKSIFSSKNPQQALADLVSKVSGDRAATEGLKRAVADYILQDVRGSLAGDESGLDLGSSRNFRKFVSANREALKTLFGGQGVNNLDMVVADMRRTGQTIQRLPGQTGTSEDVVPILQRLGQALSPGKLAAMGEGGGILLGAERVLQGDLFHGLGIMGVGAGAAVIHAFRQAGMKSVADLQLKMALNPKFAHELVQKIPQKIPPSFQRRLANSAMQTIPAIATQEQQQ